MKRRRILKAEEIFKTHENENRNHNNKKIPFSVKTTISSLFHIQCWIVSMTISDKSLFVFKSNLTDDWYELLVSDRKMAWVLIILWKSDSQLEGKIV